MSRKPTKPTKRRPSPHQETDAETPSTAPQIKDSDQGADSVAISDETGEETKTRLPAFGFAADLLGKDKSETPAAEAESTIDAARSASDSSKVDAEATTSNAAPAPSGNQATTTPDRIFRFADNLEQGHNEEQEKVARRITTWVTFALAGETFAMPVEPVREVLRVSSITRVPHAPKPIRGVTNLRGRVIPVVDLRLRIDLPPTPITRATRIVVVASRNRLIGLLVDAVHQVVHLDLNQVQPPPEDVMTLQSDYISGVYHLGDKLILLLDVDRALIVREESPNGTKDQSSGVAG